MKYFDLKIVSTPSEIGEKLIDNKHIKHNLCQSEHKNIYVSKCSCSFEVLEHCFTSNFFSSSSYLNIKKETLNVQLKLLSSTLNISFISLIQPFHLGSQSSDAIAQNDTRTICDYIIGESAGLAWLVVIAACRFTASNMFPLA